MMLIPQIHWRFTVTKFYCLCTCAVLIVFAFGEVKVNAQPPAPGIGINRTPAFSPYLNIVRQGGSATLNYFGLTRPDVQTDQSIQGLSSDVNQNRQNINNLSNLPATGHPVQFMNTGGYFLTLGQGGGIGGGR
jgi:hypothetical protein